MTEEARRIGPYALLEPVSQASRVTLWKADRADGKTRGPSIVAMRSVNDPGDRKAHQQLQREYQRLNAMVDGGVPKVHAHFAGKGALAVDWVDGVALPDILAAAEAGQVRINRSTVLEIGLSIARTLRVAHVREVPVVHGRLTPREIFLSHAGQVVLLGWGGWNPVQWPFGPPPVEPPGAPPDPPSDLWCLGMILLEILAARPLRQAGTAEALKVLRREWPAAARLVEDLLQFEIRRDLLPQNAPLPVLDVDSLLPMMLSLARQQDGVAEIAQVAAMTHAWLQQGKGDPLPASREAIGVLSLTTTEQGAASPRAFRPRPAPISITAPSAFPTIVPNAQVPLVVQPADPAPMEGTPLAGRGASEPEISTPTLDESQFDTASDPHPTIMPADLPRSGVPAAMAVTEPPPPPTMAVIDDEASMDGSGRSVGDLSSDPPGDPVPGPTGLLSRYAFTPLEVVALGLVTLLVIGFAGYLLSGC